VLLDGLMLAARKRTLLDKGVLFDRRLAFHYYDLDFCRSATRAGLRLGTWPISVTHRSVGAVGSPAWIEAGNVYFGKWGD
jgi:GT2 family glycosyltransferase